MFKVLDMWTDEQLLGQGWTQEQINQWRMDQGIQVETVTSVGAATNTLPEIVESKPGSLNAGSATFLQNKTQLILVVCMLIVAPLSLYSSMFAEGPQGPAGQEGQQGENGTAGSSFHLVQSSFDLPVCDETLQNQIFFVANDSGFAVCQNGNYFDVDLTGPQGESGLNGTDGIDGVNGTDGSDGVNGTNGTNGQNGDDGTDGTNGIDGQDGSNGADGLDGLTSLIVSSIEPNGVNCPDGGTRIDTGIDDNEDGALGSGEIDDTVFVCNGTDGNDGSDGTNGSSTSTMMVATLTIAPSYLGCNGTGQLLQQGLDDGSGGGTPQNGILEAGEILTSSLICTTFSVSQVVDMNAGTGNSAPSNFVTVNSTMYFTASAGGSAELWSLDTNGTLTSVYSGTVLGLKAVGSHLMFLGSDTSAGLEPWIFNPSNTTAWRIADINPGTSDSFAGQFTLLGTTVYFSARDGAGVFDLWAYEQSNSTVWKVDDGSGPVEIVVVGSHVYYATSNELRMYNTTSSTSYDIDINPGPLASSPSSLVVMGTTIYMSANDGSVGKELQAYETTNNSTWTAADIRTGVAGSSPSYITVMGTRLYMQATSGSYFELWVYDTVNNSFWEVSNIQSTSGSNGPEDLTAYQYTIYFSANDGTTGEELWAHHAVNGTTWQVVDLDPSGGYVGEIYLHGGNIFFASQDGTTGIELWQLVFSRTVTFV